MCQISNKNNAKARKHCHFSRNNYQSSIMPYLLLMIYYNSSLLLNKGAKYMRKSHIKSELTLRRLDSNDVEQFHELLRYAFQVTQKDLFHFDWDNEELKASKSPILENAHVLGWFHNNKLISQIALYPMQINIYNTIYKMGGITGVATYPEYSGIGLMMDLMREILKTMRNNKQSIACLYPYSIPYYRSRGWEIISDKMTFKLADHQMPKVPKVDGMIQRVAKDSKDLIALHDRFARQTHGCLIRDKLAWDEYWRWDVDDEIVAIYYDIANKPMGYIVYLLDNDIFIITGDHIFANSIGRTDLLTSDPVMMNESLNKMKKIIKNKNYIIIPGHGDIVSSNELLENNPFL